MAELSIIISILTALLTGGFLMFFIESQKVAESVINRFHFIMNPFFRSFSNYVKFIAFFNSCFTFNATKESGYMRILKNDVDKLARLGGKSITSGTDYPVGYFTAKELDSICETINNVWYVIDKNRNDVNNNLGFDTRYAQMHGEEAKKYLQAIFPEYKEELLTKDMLAKVSGDFFVEMYQPIKNISSQYEFWQKKEKEFMKLIFITIIFTVITMLLILMINLHISIWEESKVLQRASNDEHPKNADPQMPIQ